MAKEQEAEDIRVKIVRVNPDNSQYQHVNDIQVTHNEDSFFITFSIVEPPTSVEELKENNEIQAYAKAKLVLSSGFTEKVINLLTDYFGQYQENING